MLKAQLINALDTLSDTTVAALVLALLLFVSALTVLIFCYRWKLRHTEQDSAPNTKASRATDDRLMLWDHACTLQRTAPRRSRRWAALAWMLTR